MSKAKQPYAEALAAVLAMVADFKQYRELHELMRADAASGLKRATSITKKGPVKDEGLWLFENRLHNLVRALSTAIGIIDTFNSHPGLEYYGVKRIDPSTLKTFLVAIKRRLGKKAKEIGKTNQRAANREYQLDLMNALVASGVSKNEAAKELVPQGKSISPLLKRYRNFSNKKK